MKKENLTPEFLKINPQHTIPTLVDSGFSLWESRAICVYLVEKYGKNDSLYPKNPKTRAVINQRFYFDMGTLFKAFYEYYFAEFYGKEKTQENLTKLNEGVELLDGFLGATGFVAGTQEISLADLVLYASVSTFTIFEFDFTAYPRVKQWLALMDEIAPGRESNSEGIEQMKGFLKSFSS